MNKIRNIKIKEPVLTVLFLGFISCLVGGIWLCMVSFKLYKIGIIGYYGRLSSGGGELAFCALLHIIIALILYIAEKKRS